ncbi:MAG: tRNA pseudouridine(13) synthase TruD [Methanobacterium sp.]|nr:tRNA pseudouridine(13) synthase TruD [Methanobacterium sp.]
MLNAETYETDKKGIGGSIRNEREDFYVEEIPLSLPSGNGPNTWIFIEKIGRNTLDVVLDIAKELKISRKRMGFAGMKDKTARTRQWLCVSNSSVEEIQSISDKLYNVEVLEIKQNEKKLRIGQLVGNKFKILIRNTEDPENDVKTAQAVLEHLMETGVPNYYGWQRFGKERSNTHLVGEYLVHNDVKGAVDAYIGNPYPEEREHIKEARALYDEGKLEEAYQKMPGSMRYEKMLLRELLNLQRKKGELTEKSYIIAIESLPKPLKRMFVHAYQSYLFNKAVSERAKLGINKYVEGDILIDNEEHLVHEFDVDTVDERIRSFEIHPTSPLYGTKVPVAGGVVGKFEQKVIDEENIKLEEFECPKTPRLGSHGLRRAMRFKIWDVSAELTPEGVLTEFSIPKGCYATAVLREIMKEDVY